MSDINMLEYSQVKKFLEYYNMLDIDDDKKYFVCHEMELSVFDELSLKRLLFEYQLLIYCKTSNSKINNFIMLQVPPILKKTNTLEIVMMGLYDTDFIKDVCVIVKESFQNKGWGKIVLNLLKFQHNKDYDNLFSETGFQKELELKAGQENYNQYYYTYLF